MKIEDCAPLVKEFVVLNQLWDDLNRILLILVNYRLQVFIVGSTELVARVLDTWHYASATIFSTSESVAETPAYVSETPAYI